LIFLIENTIVGNAVKWYAMSVLVLKRKETEFAVDALAILLAQYQKVVDINVDKVKVIVKINVH
jgi:NADH:ubiquinone oxidoreductase subunit K